MREREKKGWLKRERARGKSWKTWKLKIILVVEFFHSAKERRGMYVGEGEREMLKKKQRLG